MAWMAWTIGWLLATIFISLMWHSIDPIGDLWLRCAALAAGVLMAIVAIQYWMVMIPVAVLGSLVGTAAWYLRQPQAPAAALARVSEGRKN